MCLHVPRRDPVRRAADPAIETAGAASPLNCRPHVTRLHRQTWGLFIGSSLRTHTGASRSQFFAVMCSFIPVKQAGFHSSAAPNPAIGSPLPGILRE